MNSSILCKSEAGKQSEFRRLFFPSLPCKKKNNRQYILVKIGWGHWNNLKKNQGCRFGPKNPSRQTLETHQYHPIPSVPSVAECFRNVPHRLEISAIFTQKAFQPRFLGVFNKQFREVGQKNSSNLWIYGVFFSNPCTLRLGFNFKVLFFFWLVDWKKACFKKKI